VILVDTSVWIEHLRRGSDRLAGLLEENLVLMHPFVRGELACGNLSNREAVLTLLGDLPRARTPTDDEVLHYIELNALMGRGIGYVDAHLLVATALNAPARLWTLDRNLRAVAKVLDLAIGELP